MDSLVLYNPAGATSLQVGSWLRADVGPDFGTHDMIRALETENPLRDGGAFAFQRAPIRHFKLPLTLRTVAPADGDVTNLMTNPSFEVDLTSWAAFGNTTIVRDVAQSKYGPSSMKLSSLGAGNYGAAASVTISGATAGRTYAASAWYFGQGPSIGRTYQVDIIETGGASGTSATSVTGTVVAGWQRVSGARTIVQNDRTGIQINTYILAAAGAGEVFWVDGVQVELGSTATTYIDGTQPFCVWNGAANASTSTRTQVTMLRAESLLRLLGAPGGYIDIQPEGVASAESVRFDIIHGRWEPDYSVYHNRIGVRQGFLNLDVQPYGYWPTTIVIATAAALMSHQTLAIAGASIIGDAPVPLSVLFTPTDNGSYYVSQSSSLWYPDFLAWSVAGKPSFLPFLAGGSFNNIDQAGTPNIGTWSPGRPDMKSWTATTADFKALGGYLIPSGLEPAYRGRFRAFVLANVNASVGNARYLTVDAVRETNAGMASSQPIASVAPGVASTGGVIGAYGAMPSNAMQILDAGELTLPPNGSGIQQNYTIRIWDGAASGVTVSQRLDIAGVYLLPIDQRSGGVLPRGLVWPSMMVRPNGTLHRVWPQFDAVANTMPAWDSFAPTGAYGDVRALFRGQLAYGGATTTMLTMLIGGRQGATGATAPVVFSSPFSAGVVVGYRPTFQFLRGL